jgi:hypothetical protein
LQRQNIFQRKGKALIKEQKGWGCSKYLSMMKTASCQLMKINKMQMEIQALKSWRKLA